MTLLRSLILEMRSRPHRVVHDLAAADSTPESSEAYRWSEIPEELLREILIRVEAADGGEWPSRRSVVACAGVCRGWRLLMNETVLVPEISSKLTFPISLKQVLWLILIELRHKVTIFIHHFQKLLWKTDFFNVCSAFALAFGLFLEIKFIRKELYMSISIQFLCSPIENV